MPGPRKTYDDVSQAFTTGSVLTAKKEDLEQLLLAIASARILSEENRAAASQRGETVRQLLAVRQSEQMHGQAMTVARVALIVSLASLAVSVYQLFR